MLMLMTMVVIMHVAPCMPSSPNPPAERVALCVKYLPDQRDSQRELQSLGEYLPGANHEY